MTENERNELFLKELSDLTRKHGIKIGGCGCCGSPYLEHIRGGVVELCDHDDETPNWYSVDMNRVEYSHSGGEDICFDKEIK